MIVGQDTKPERQIYHLGALLLEALGDTGEPAELFDVYEAMNRVGSVSVGAFLLALDWLFVLGAVVSDDGKVARCS